ncbi:hypothetical protein A2U01_0097280, partial [Trifolium medium]|nr:hypothetical protein [Trifolium medium]
GMNSLISAMFMRSEKWELGQEKGGGARGRGRRGA